MVKKRIQAWRYDSPDSVHNSGKYCLLAMFLSVMAVLFLDFWLLVSWDDGQFPFSYVLVIHSLACLLFLMQSTMCWWLHRAWGFGLLSFPLVLVLGPLGAMGMLLTALVFVFIRESATPFDTWYEEILPASMTPPEERMVEHLRLWGHEAEIQHRNLIPFEDVLSSGSVQEKQSTIDIIVRNYDPSFAPILRGALKDPVNTIRTHAVAAITRIEEIYQDQTFLLEEELRHTPNTADKILNLALHFDEHAHAGLSDDDTLIDHRVKAEKLYRQLSELDADDERVLWLLGRLLLRNKSNAEALNIFETALERANHIVQPQQRIWYWECLYELQHFSTLREQVKRFYKQVSSCSNMPEPLLESVSLWVNDLEVQKT